VDQRTSNPREFLKAAVRRASVVTLVLTLTLDSAQEHMTASMKTWAWQTFIEGHETTRIMAGQLHLLPDVFPEKLGPMRLVEVPSLHELFRCDDIGPEDSNASFPPRAWEMHPEDLAQEPHQIMASETVQLRLSQEAQLTFGKDRRNQLGIPNQMTHLRFVYPMSISSTQLKIRSIAGNEGAEDFEAVKYFLDIGGFVFYNKKKEAIVRTLVPHEVGSSAISFERREWKRCWTEPLHRQRRFSTITLKQLNDVGAKYFTWLLPGERIECAQGGYLPDLPHGGFAYLFHAPGQGTSWQMSLDCYFAIKRWEPFRTTRDGDPVSQERTLNITEHHQMKEALRPSSGACRDTYCDVQVASGQSQ